eukprot:6226300-Amphidinium_carterae.1
MEEFSDDWKQWPLLPDTPLGHFSAGNAWSGNLAHTPDTIPNPVRMNLLGQELAHAIRSAHSARLRCSEDFVESFFADDVPAEVMRE